MRPRSPISSFHSHQKPNTLVAPRLTKKKASSLRLPATMQQAHLKEVSKSLTHEPYLPRVANRSPSPERPSCPQFSGDWAPRRARDLDGLGSEASCGSNGHKLGEDFFKLQRVSNVEAILLVECGEMPPWGPRMQTDIPAAGGTFAPTHPLGGVLAREASHRNLWYIRRK